MKKQYKIIIAVVLTIIFIYIIYLIAGRQTDSKMNIKETNLRQFKFYKNPIAKKGDFADPFILKFNGVYYLYCTNPGVKCWSSTNLIDWKLEGTVVKENQLDGFVPFAPEVVYWNGYFYMYTSPSGHGHYILRSESPTGPFTIQTDNLGNSIDGSVFIDDDGKWYFYNADNSGIIAHMMKNPLTIGDKISTNVYMDGWTEGPGVIKRNGKYYMTYTGNHYLSTGYRIDYATSSKSPVSGYVPYSKNPFLVNTQGEGVGLGHSTSFIGPNLDTWYITYHNLNADTTRDLDIDKLGWNGDKMVVFGPTQSNQTVPEMPDFYDYFQRNELGNKWGAQKGTWKCDNGFLSIDTADKEKGNMIISEFKSEKDYTAEFNMKLSGESNSNSSRFGAVVSFKDDKNYGTILLNPFKNTVETEFIVDGKLSKQQISTLPDGYDYTKLHNIRIEKYGSTIKIFIDGMLKQTRIVDGLNLGNIGFYSDCEEAKLGYTGVTNSANGQSTYKDYKPVPGTVEAVHYNAGGENSGYHMKTKENSNCDFRDDGCYLNTCSEGGYNTALKAEGEWLAYNVNVEESKKYNLDMRVANVKKGTKIKLWLDDTLVSNSEALNIAETDQWRTLSLKALKLEKGPHTFRIELVKSGFDFYSMNFYKASNEKISFKENFSADVSNWDYVAGVGEDLIIEDGILQLGPYGKLVAGDNSWDDYTTEVDVKGDASLNSGIIFRVTNPAEGGEGADCKLGTNFYEGYFVGLTENGVVLNKQSYNCKELAKSQGSYNPDKKYHLKVVVKGDNIKIFVDDMKVAKIDFTDKDPFTHGKVGLRSEGAIANFDNFTVNGK